MKSPFEVTTVKKYSVKKLQTFDTKPNNFGIEETIKAIKLGCEIKAIESFIAKLKRYHHVDVRYSEVKIVGVKQSDYVSWINDNFATCGFSFDLETTVEMGGK